MLCIKFKGQSKGKGGRIRRNACVPQHSKEPEVICEEEGQQLIAKFMGDDCEASALYSLMGGAVTGVIV